MQGATDIGLDVVTLPFYYGLTEGAWKHWSRVWEVEYDYLLSRFDSKDIMETPGIPLTRWFDERLVQGLRVDHPDGLRDPAGYLDDLDRLTGGDFVLVEKILEPGEELSRDWATAGTTGYAALALIVRVLTEAGFRVRGSQLNAAVVLAEDLKEAVNRGFVDEVEE